MNLSELMQIRERFDRLEQRVAELEAAKKPERAVLTLPKTTTKFEELKRA